MAKAGYIVEQNDTLPANLISLCHDLKVNPHQAAQRLQTTKIAVQTFADLEPKDMVASLQALNIQVINQLDSEKPDLTVVLTDDYLNPDLEQFNQESLRSRSASPSARSQIPWLLVKPVGTMIWLGPLFNIERYSGVFQGYEPRIVASYQELGAQAIHPNQCLNFSQQQYETRAEWNIFTVNVLFPL
ncbi:hypothetical protein Xen7305DRAFT_00050990 [Xenococcus sp. PCC 7305]|uniref:YcaO-like family protein n=1 Tax=Xenococcus sp. PCC 7305 TaxID=102125 RepID=UPI0002AC2659|nr:YcaO-like family protein [Xenococcus sp. PCC 7305]ELS05356.1 hypothetical protein Xen7305DRAFT_00050990 [Xenococcus sp. PCC 7305]